MEHMGAVVEPLCGSRELVIRVVRTFVGGVCMTLYWPFVEKQYTFDTLMLLVKCCSHLLSRVIVNVM